MDSNEDHVKQILRAHKRAPTIWGQSLRIESTENLPHSLVRCLLRHDPLELEKPLDSAPTSSAMFHEHSQASAQVGEPSRIFRLITDIAWRSQISGADSAVALESEMG